MPTAVMGYFGNVSFVGLPGDTGELDRQDAVVRATDISLNMTQTIDKPPLVDGRFDHTTYQLGPREVGGGVNFPAIHSQAGVSGSSADIMAGIWKATMDRLSTDGRMEHSLDAYVKYAGNTGHNYGGTAEDVAFIYTSCLVNTLELSVSQGDILTTNMDLIGIDRLPGNDVPVVYPSRNTRIVTWNDIILGFNIVQDGTQKGVVKGDAIRQFSLNVNNNVQRFYTLNNKLTPEDVTATKRDLSGSATALGRIFRTSEQARTNENRCSEFSELIFGFRAAGTGNSADGDFSCDQGMFVYLPGVVFEIETLGLSPDLFETTMNFHVLPGAPQSTFSHDSEFVFSPDISTGWDTTNFLYTGDLINYF